MVGIINQVMKYDKRESPKFQQKMIWKILAGKYKFALKLATTGFYDTYKL